MNLSEFVENHCVGKQYDSCVESPCAFASHSGCRHPLHPKHAAQHHAHLTSESLASSQAVVNASALSKSDGDTPPAQAQVA